MYSFCSSIHANQFVNWLDIDEMGCIKFARRFRWIVKGKKEKESEER